MTNVLLLGQCNESDEILSFPGSYNPGMSLF